MPVPNSFANVTTSIPLSQLDANFNTPITLGNTAIQLGNTVTTLNNMTLANVTISSGNTTVTSETISGNLTFTGTGNRITGDFSNATIANRVIFQSSTVNGASDIPVIPNGTGTNARHFYYSSSDTANASLLTAGVVGTEATFRASAVGSGTSPAMTFYTGGSERMRIDTSGNVGIGTATLGGIRFVSVGSASYGSTPNVAGAFRASDTAGNDAALIIGSINGTDPFIGASGATGGGFRPLRFYTSDTEQMRLDASGNLGLGVTPSAWNSSAKVLDISTTSSVVDFTSQTWLANNLFLNSSSAWIYKTTNFGSLVAQAAGDFIFYRTASGTAGATATLQESMRITSAGNVGIGTSSPATALTLGNNRVLSWPNAAGNYNGTTTGTQIFKFSDNNLYIDNLDASTNIIFRRNGPTESMRINSSGNVGIGTSSPGQRLTISDSNSSNQLGLTGAQQNAMQFLNAAGGSGFIIGRSITVNDANNFFIYDAAAAATRIVIDSSGSTQFVNGNVMPYQGAPTSKSTTATLTGAELITGILNTTGTTYTITLPTGANIEAAQNWWGVNTCLDWFVINTASGTITIGANGNTTLGSLTIATGTSAQFRIRRTAVNTFTVYRL